jgi:peptidyl-tRNA hydrolase, PTH1 family
MRMIVGIGNHGATYAGTRHNCGFMVLDVLAARHGLNGWQKRFQALTVDWTTPNGEKTLLLKPQTYVNQSGASVLAAMTFYKVAPADILVVVDDIHLALGHVRLRPSGSAGGHNGLRDIERVIGQQYARLRLGVGQPQCPGEQIDFVLGKFTSEEQPDVQKMLDKSADCVTSWITHGQEIACRYNGPLNQPTSSDSSGSTGSSGKRAPSTEK